jgi:2-polyprenyl-6-hydroxyphenyl methylase/3-demethylubiquinone-9 3-methyltransferase
MQRLRQLSATIAYPLIGYRPEKVAAETWDQQYRDGIWRRLRRIENLAGLAMILGYCEFLDPKSILDVGCGEGLLAHKLRSRAYKDYLGVDVSDEAILQAQHLANDRTRFTVAQAESFDPGRTFDVIIFNQCLYYMAEPAAILMRYQKFLVPQGRLIVSMYDTPRTRAAWRDVKRVMQVEDEITTIQNNGRSTTAVLMPR